MSSPLFLSPYRSGADGKEKNMKYMIASDLHGSAAGCRSMLEAFRRENAGRLFLLGDLLYHGPRNPLPQEYDPKMTAAMLNEIKESILCVRGNCDAEVDQMLLQFPVLAGYALAETEGLELFLHHGHIYGEDSLPPLQREVVSVYGHTHIFRAEEKEGRIYVNPGSVSLPKGGNPATYAVLENRNVQIKTMEGETLRTMKL